VSTVTGQRLITAIVPEDVDTLALATELHERFAITAAFRHFGRGVGRTTRRTRRAPLIPERRILFSVVVAPEHADAVFAWLLQAARIGRAGGGLVYQQRLGAGLAVS
jgi:nitrogen regulatory protein PII